MIKNNFFTNKLLLVFIFCLFSNLSFAIEIDSNSLKIIDNVKKSSSKTMFVGTAIFENVGGSKKVSSVSQSYFNEKLTKKVVSIGGLHVVEIHTKHELHQYLPAEKLIKIRNTAKPSFPTLFFGDPKDILNFYTLKSTNQGSVIAGLSALGYELTPKDNLRWGVKFWVDSNSGLLLKVEYLNPNGVVVKRDYFSDIIINPKEEIDLKNPFPDSKTWRSLYISRFNENQPKEIRFEPVSGFKLVNCFDTKFKQLENTKFEKNHCMFSDGVATISIVAFTNPRPDVYFAKKLITRGCSSYKSGLISNRSVSTFGCVPKETIQYFFNNSIAE